MKIPFRFFPALLMGALTITLFMGPAAAQEQPKNQAPESIVRLEVQAGYFDKADIEDGPGEVGYSYIQVSAKAHGFDLGYERRDYSWGNSSALPFGNGAEEPFDALHALWLGYEHKGRISRELGWRAQVKLSSAFEDDILGLPTAMVMGGFDYMAADGVILMGGLLASCNEVEQFVYPYLGLLYRPGARDGVSGLLGFPVTHISYHINPQAQVSLRTGYLRRTYKLADDNTVRPDGEFRTRDFMAGLSFSYSFSPMLSLELGAEYRFARDITFFDDGGRAGSEYDLDNTWGGFGRLSIRF